MNDLSEKAVERAAAALAVEWFAGGETDQAVRDEAATQWLGFMSMARAALVAAGPVPTLSEQKSLARLKAQVADLDRPFDNVVACEADDLRALLRLTEAAA